MRSEFGGSGQTAGLPQSYPLCYEAAILGKTTENDDRQTGTLYKCRANAAPILAQCARTLALPDTWFTLEVIARHNHFVVKVNGELTADCVDGERPYRKGHLALQTYGAGTVVHFRKIEIKELPAGHFEDTATVSSAPSEYEVRRYVGHTAGVVNVCILSDGERFASCGDDGTVRLWDLETAAELQCLRGHSGSVRTVAALPDGRRLVSCSWDETVRGWDAETGRELQRFTGHRGAVRDVTVLPDGKRVVSAGLDKTLRVWDVDSGQQLAMLELDRPGCSVAALPDGRHVLSGDSVGVLHLWDLDEASLVERFEGHTDEVKQIAVSPDGRRALSAGAMDGTVRLWDLETGEELHRFEGHGSHAHGGRFSPDGSLALTSGHTKMFLWDLETGRKLATFRAPGHFNAAAFVPDDLHLVSAHWTDARQHDVLRLWEMSESLWPEEKVLERLAQVTESIEADPDDVGLFHQRGRLYARLERFDEAARDFIRANELLASPWGWKATSGVFHSVMQHEKVFTRIAELRPDDLALWCSRGHYYALRGQWERALPDYARWSQGQSYVLCYPRVLLLTGDEEGYRRVCQRMAMKFAQTNQPEIARLLVVVCSSDRKSGLDPARLVKWAQLSLRAGRNKDTLQALALAYYRAGQFDQTVTLLQEAMDLSPDAMPRSDAAFPLALAYRALGQEEEARKWYRFGVAEVERVAPRNADDPVPWAVAHWLNVKVWHREAEEIFGPIENRASASDDLQSSDVLEEPKPHPENRKGDWR